MRLYLEIVEGPSKGQKLSLSKKTSVGRKGAELLLNDVKLSGIHAFFDYSESEGWSIQDNKSRNGVWVNGMKEIKMILNDGDEVLIGSSRIICRILDTGIVNWSQGFKIWVENLYKAFKNNKVEHEVIKPEIRLRVVQGLQFGQTWDVFYGPRRAGKNSDDICLYEETAPVQAFEIRVKGKYAYFYTDHEQIVKINRKSLREKQFIPGDIISIGESEILVEVDEGHGFSN